MFTDSFRADRIDTDPTVSGVIRYRGNEFLADQTDGIPRKQMLRGLSVRGDVLAVGFSFFAPRERRLTEDGAGGLLLFRDNVLTVSAEGPFSQVYDVLPLDGIRTDRPGPDLDGDALHRLFDRDVGPLLYDRPLPIPKKLRKLGQKR
jgi:hypothetical protein